MVEAPSALNGPTSDWRRYKVNRAAAASSRPPAQASTDRRTANRRGPRRSASVAAPAVAVTESLSRPPRLAYLEQQVLVPDHDYVLADAVLAGGLAEGLPDARLGEGVRVARSGDGHDERRAGGGGIVPAALRDPCVRLFPEIGGGDDEDLPAAGQRGAGRRPVLGEPVGQVVGHQPVGELLGLGLLLRLRRCPAEGREVTGEHRGEHRRQR